MSSLVARLHDAAITPEAWPYALTALTDAAGVAGAALIISTRAQVRRDILGTRLVDTSGHCVIFGIHQQIGRGFSDSVDSVLNLAGIPLKHAAWRHTERLSSPRSAIFDLSQTEVSAEASRFYFHVDNGSRYPDETGSVFSTADDATAHAIVVAQELAQEGSWHGSSILVTDVRGNEIVRVRIGR